MRHSSSYLLKFYEPNDTKNIGSFPIKLKLGNKNNCCWSPKVFLIIG